MNSARSRLLATLVFALVALPACTPSQAKTSICHATGDAANPYEEISIGAGNVSEHQSHPNDFWPVPAGGCPTAPLTISTDGKITICHATNSQNNPYNEITIDRNGLNGHAKHEGDIIPAPAGGCSS
jgi:hypothetical protein